VSDVLEHLDHGLQHVIQAGIDRANQSARITAHMISDWRIMPTKFSFEVQKKIIKIAAKIAAKFAPNIAVSNLVLKMQYRGRYNTGISKMSILVFCP
jgi:hypothetical protein